MAIRHDPLIGQEIDGYRIEKLVGKGGMARVYQAVDVRLKRNVVIKVIKPSAQTDEHYRIRFEKEALAIAQLEHQHIVRIYRFGEVENLYYMAMQYVDGADLSWILADYVKDNALLPHEDVLRIISQLSLALDFAHSRGVIHRDVKPANVMIDAAGNATLTDFGLVLFETEGPYSGTFGTPHYMSPEQAMDAANVVPQSDLYSLGVVLYEMLTGSLPFTSGSATEIATAHVTQEPPNPLQLNPGLHPAFGPVLTKALQKEPNARFQSGADLAAELREAIRTAEYSPHSNTRTLMHLSQRQVADTVSLFYQERTLAAGMAVPHPAPASSTRPKTNQLIPVQRAVQTFNRSLPAQILLGIVIGLFMLCGLALLVSLTLLRNVAANTPTATHVVAVVTPTVMGVASTLVAPTEITFGAITDPTSPLFLVTPAQDATTTAPVVTPSPAPSATLVAVALRFITDGEESLYIMNISPTALDIASLELRGSQQGALIGTEWGIEQLNNQECVRVLKGENARIPSIACYPVGNLLMRDGPERFWKPEFGTFDVYYAGTFIGSCDTAGCVLPIPVTS